MSDESEANGRLVRESGKLSALTMVSRGLGLIRDRTRGALMGTGMLADAFTVAFSVPNLFRRLFAEGSMSVAFIPTVKAYFSEGDREKTEEFLSATFTALSGAVCAVVAAGIAAAPLLVRLFDSEPVETAVLMRARQLAKKHKVAKFNAARFKAAIPGLLEFSKDVAGIEGLPAFFANLGVHLVIVPALSHSYMDGAVFYAGSNPVILLTLRYDRVDNFWFTLTHEVAHLVANHHGVHIDTNLEKPSDVAAEQTADKLASEWLLESATYEKFLSSSGHFYSRETVASYADSVKRHPGIVVGRLHHQKKVPYSQLRGMLEKVSPYLQKCIDTSYAG